MVADVNLIGVADRSRATVLQLLDEDEVGLDRDALLDRLLLDFQAADLVRRQLDRALVDVHSRRRVHVVGCCGRGE